MKIIHIEASAKSSVPFGIKTSFKEVMTAENSLDSSIGPNTFN